MTMKRDVQGTYTQYGVPHIKQDTGLLAGAANRQPFSTMAFDTTSDKEPSDTTGIVPGDAE